MSNQKVYGPWIKWHGGSGYGAQMIEENGRPVLTFWPYCTECKSPFQFDADEPFAYCFCGNTEWGDPRPASWVCSPRQPLNEEMNDKTEQTVTDELRLAAKSAEPYLTATVGASHLNKAADTIDNLRAQLVEAQRDSARLKNDAAIFYEAAAGLLTTNDTLRAELAEAQRRIKELETPTMFWDFDNPEHGAFDSPYYAICDGDFDDGAEVSFMTARALPTKTVRVTRDSEGNYGYEYIDTAKGE